MDLRSYKTVIVILGAVNSSFVFPIDGGAGTIAAHLQSTSQRLPISTILRRVKAQSQSTLEKRLRKLEHGVSSLSDYFPLAINSHPNDRQVTRCYRNPSNHAQLC